MTRTLVRADLSADLSADLAGGSAHLAGAGVRFPPAGVDVDGAAAGGVVVEGVLSGLSSASDLVAMAAQAPLAGAGGEALEQVVAAGGRLRSAVEALLLAATAALEADRKGSGRAALRNEARMSARAAARKAAVSGQVAQMPAVARGLASGALTVEHAEVLADTARRCGPDAVDGAAGLLETAAQLSPDVLRRDAQRFVAQHDPAAAESELARQRRERSAALFTDDETGMGVLNARFDPVSFALVLQAVENYNDALWRLDGGRDGTPEEVRGNRQRLADSVFEMLTGRNALASRQDAADGAFGPVCNDLPSSAANGADVDGGAGGGKCGCGAGAGGGGRSVDRWAPSQAPNQLVIVADLGVIDGTAPDGRCEVLGAGPVPKLILNDLSPDTRITGALFAGPGQPLWLGRGRRLASAAQQLAVAIRDRGCVLCGAAMHRCRYHHVDEWDADHGTTDVPNLAALCNDCHNTLHKRGQRLRRDASTGHWVTQRRPEQPDQPPRRAHPAGPASPQAPRAQVSQRDPP
ncbi:MAG: hypothetical protein F4064_02580 [Acidimicrobiales bacterium]|nr:hypothetical protein [Acidimicrobiales bacterium]MYI26956.1 hypothetical protein [Acidimicrobiales bacterium]